MLQYLFVLLAVAVRFLPFAGSFNVIPHAWHFTPLGASLLFFGARGSRRQMWIPLALLVATDVVLSRFIYTYPIAWDQFVIWGWYTAVIWLGTSLRVKAGMFRVIGAALGTSVSFFLLTNFTSWAAYSMYPKNLHGLMMSYAAGLPFFRGTVESDLFFSLAMFGTPVLAHAMSGWFNKAAGNNIAAA